MQDAGCTMSSRRNWEVCRHVGWGRLYAALKPSGFLSISGYTHERMGSPDGYLLMFDRSTRTIGLKAARMGVDKGAVRPARGSKATNKNRTIFVRPMCQEFGIAVEETVVFDKCHIDEDGVFILDLNHTRALRKKSQARNQNSKSRRQTTDEHR
jgi:hypothetical protein